MAVVQPAIIAGKAVTTIKKVITDPERYKESTSYSFIPEVRKVTEPLKRIGVSYFSYAEIDINASNVLHLINSDDVGGYDVKNNGAQIETQCLILSEGLYFLNVLPKPNVKADEYYAGRFKAEGSLETHLLVEKTTDNVIKSFCFGIANLKLFRFEFFEAFSHYFSDKASKLITQSDKYKITMPKQNIQSSLPCSAYVGMENLAQFLNDIDYYHYKLYSYAKKYLLCRRELQCLDLIIQNKINKQIAGILGLNIRTVEEYINNLKRKFGCRSKLELVLKVL